MNSILKHVELLEILGHHLGRILLSGYDNNIYNDMLPGWKKVKKSTRAECGLKRVETLWMNYDAGQEQLSLYI